MRFELTTIFKTLSVGFVVGFSNGPIKFHQELKLMTQYSDKMPYKLRVLCHPSHYDHSPGIFFVSGFLENQTNCLVSVSSANKMENIFSAMVLIWMGETWTVHTYMYSAY